MLAARLLSRAWPPEKDTLRFLITFAIGEEFGPWRRRGGFRESDGVGFLRREAELDIVALETGMGPTCARRATANALDGAHFDLVISAGLAGGLKPDLYSGALVTARLVKEAESGRETGPATEWLELAEQLGARSVAFVTTEGVTTTAADKRRLGLEADVVEMESFAVLDEAAKRRIPAVAIRAVSDSVDVDLPLDFTRVVDERGKVRAVSLAGAVMRRPASIAGLARLARDSRRAATILAEFLERYVKAAAGESRRFAVESEVER